MNLFSGTKMLGIGATAMLGLASMANAATMIPATQSSDNVLQGNFQVGGPSVFLTDNGNADRVGTGGTTGQQRTNVPVLGFTLPTIPVGETVSAAAFSFTMDSASALNNSPAFDLVVSLLGVAAIGDIDATFYTDDASSLGAGNFLVGSLTTSDVATGSTETFNLTGGALTFLAGLYDGAGNPSQTEIFFRLSPSSPINPATTGNSRYQLDDSAVGGVARTLTLTTVPEPSSFSLLGLGVLGLLARRRRR